MAEFSRNWNLLGNRGSKAGQMEIIGILVIIVLLILGLLFTVRFMAGQEPSGELAKRVENKEISTNMLFGVLNSRSTCDDLEVEDLVKNCAENFHIGCTASSSMKVCSVGDVSVCACEFTQNVFQSIFDETLDVWQKDYEFSIDYGTENPERIMEIIPKPCEGNSDPAILPLPTNKKNVILTLRICG